MEFVRGTLIQRQSPVPYSMALLQSPRFKFGAGTSQRLVAGMLAPFSKRKTGRTSDYVVDVFGVIFPVGCDIQVAARSQFGRQKFQEVRLKNAPFVMPLFWPRIREKQVNSSQARLADLLPKNVNGVVDDYSEVFQPRTVGGNEAVANAGFMYLDTEKVQLRILDRHLHQAIAIAESYFQHFIGCPAEDVTEIEIIVG